MPVTRLYSAEQTRQLDQCAIEQYHIPGYELMCRAGKAVFDLARRSYPLAKKYLVICGAGNNAGDGYVVARLAMEAGLSVELVSLVDMQKLSGDAKTACQQWQSMGHQQRPFSRERLDEAELIIDALLGTGLQRDVTGEWAALIEQINRSDKPVIAVDIPSGICADTGRVRGVAVQANKTLSFIGLNRGLFTGQALDYRGELSFDDLQIPAAVYEQVEHDGELLQWDSLCHQLRPRPLDSHKGNNGHVLVIGGDYGTVGAVRLAAEAALRSGAGLVTVLTRAEHITAIVAGRPEIMVQGIKLHQSIHPYLQRASVIIIGPGLGQGDWGRCLLSQVLESHLPKVLDADALNLLAAETNHQDKNWVLTPHPAEAARLLATSTQDCQQNRYAAVALLQQQYGGVALLKGAGSLIQADHTPAYVCPYGNPGMATAGMGDVLSGIIASLIAQGLDNVFATRLAVALHGKAGDMAAENGQRGLIASDLFMPIRSLLNT